VIEKLEQHRQAMASDPGTAISKSSWRKLEKTRLRKSLSETESASAGNDSGRGGNRGQRKCLAAESAVDGAKAFTDCLNDRTRNCSTLPIVAS
jgi:hypothetical protein